MSTNQLSVVIITHNAEKFLPDCLQSIKHWVHEIIVLDYKSQDKTCKIAKQAGAHVYQTNKWLGFGKQRQLAQKYATNDYILALDADERVSKTLKKSIISILQKPISNTVYSCTRKNLFLKHWMQHSGWYPDWTIRLYPRKTHQYNSMKIHESLNINNAKIITLQGELLHIACHCLITFQNKQLKYAQIWATEQFYQGKTCNIFTIIIHTISTFLKTLVLDVSFFDGKYGLLLAIIKSQYTFNKYAILWSLKHQQKL